MSVIITLPEEIEAHLQRAAEAQHRSVEELARDILVDAFNEEESVLTPEAVVAKIQATPPNPSSIRSASGSLADALRNAPQDPNFDYAAWQQEWAAVEAEMKAITRTNDIAERRR